MDLPITPMGLHRDPQDLTLECSLLHPIVVYLLGIHLVLIRIPGLQDHPMDIRQIVSLKKPDFDAESTNFPSIFFQVQLVLQCLQSLLKAVPPPRVLHLHPPPRLMRPVPLAQMDSTNPHSSQHSPSPRIGPIVVGKRPNKTHRVEAHPEVIPGTRLDNSNNPARIISWAILITHPVAHIPVHPARVVVWVRAQKTQDTHGMVWPVLPGSGRPLAQFQLHRYGKFLHDFLKILFYGSLSL